MMNPLAALDKVQCDASYVRRMSSRNYHSHVVHGQFIPSRSSPPNYVHRALSFHQNMNTPIAYLLSKGTVTNSASRKKRRQGHSSIQATAMSNIPGLENGNLSPAWPCYSTSTSNFLQTIQCCHSTTLLLQKKKKTEPTSRIGLFIQVGFIHPLNAFLTPAMPFSHPFNGSLVWPLAFATASCMSTLGFSISPSKCTPFKGVKGTPASPDTTMSRMVAQPARPSSVDTEILLFNSGQSLSTIRHHCSMSTSSPGLPEHVFVVRFPLFLRIPPSVNAFR